MTLSAGIGYFRPADRNLIAELIAGLIDGVIASVIAGDILYDTTVIPEFCHFSFEKRVIVDFNLPSFETAGYPPFETNFPKIGDKPRDT